MKRWGLFLLCCLGLVLLFGVLPSRDNFVKPAQAATMKPMQLIADAATYQEKSPDAMVLTYFCKEVEKKTNGLITFKYAFLESLTKRGEEFQALKSGLCHVGTFGLALFPSQLYLNNVCRAVPFVSNDISAMGVIIKRLFERESALSAEWEKQGAKLLIGNVGPSFELQSRAVISKLDDFKGKKIVISGVRAKKLFQVVGATPVTVPLPERALALQTGMVDGSVLPFSVAFPYGLHNYAKHATFIEFGAWLAVGIAINKKLFDGFPKDIQQAILEAAENANRYNFQIQKQKDDETLAAMKEAGVSFQHLSNENKMKWMDLMGNQPQDWIEEGEKLGLPARKVMETYLTLIKESGYRFPKEWTVK